LLPGIDSLTAADSRNGWTLASLAAYRREREKVHGLVAGNVVTEFKRPKPAMRVEGPRGYSPFTKTYG
jgi:hypothetical protein